MPVSSRTKDTLALPIFWETDGAETARKQVKPYSVEGIALAQYFRKGMPEDVELSNIYRVETAQPWQHYKLHRNEIYKRLIGQESSLDGVEMYLWHGSDPEAIEQAVATGFDLAHSNMECNHYGAGLYFATDPRLAHFFCREARQSLGAQHQLILARVAVGHCAEKEALPLHDPACKRKHSGCSWKKCQDLRTAELRKPQNRKAPSGYDSCTSQYRTEVIVYKDFHAYPAYIFEYHCLSLTHFDPYRRQRQLLNFRMATQKNDFVIDFEAVRQHATAPHAVNVDENESQKSNSDNDADRSPTSHSCSRDRQNQKAINRRDRSRSLSESSRRVSLRECQNFRRHPKSTTPPRRRQSRSTTRRRRHQDKHGRDMDNRGAHRKRRVGRRQRSSTKSSTPSQERRSDPDSDHWILRSCSEASARSRVSSNRASDRSRSPSRISSNRASGMSRQTCHAARGSSNKILQAALRGVCMETARAKCLPMPPSQAARIDLAAKRAVGEDMNAAKDLVAEEISARKEKATLETVSTEKAEADKLAAEALATERASVVAMKAAASAASAEEKDAADEIAAERAAAGKAAAADKVVADKLAAEKAAGEKAAAAADKAAADQLAAEKAAREKLAAEDAAAAKAASAVAQDPAPAFPFVFDVFDKVRLHGLKAKPELNGSEGSLLRFDSCKRRWQVRMESDPSTVHLVKPESLLPSSLAQALTAEPVTASEDRENTPEPLRQQVAAPVAIQTMTPEMCVRRRVRGRGAEEDDRYAGKSGIFERLAEDDSLEGPAGSIHGWVLIASGIHDECQEDDVFEAFAEFGDVKNLHLNLDRRTGFVKGYAFIEYESKLEGDSAIRGLNGAMLLDRIIQVAWAFGKDPGKRDNVGSRDVVSAIGASSCVVSKIGAPAETPSVIPKVVTTISSKRWTATELADIAEETREKKKDAMVPWSHETVAEEGKQNKRNPKVKRERG